MVAGLSSLLNTARDALQVQSYALNVTGQNVANASTPLYVRREAVIQSSSYGTAQGSVEVLGVRRAADAFADQQLFSASSQSAAASQYDDELSQIEALFNDASGTGLGSVLDDLFSSFQDLAASPNDPTVRDQVLQRIETFATRAQSVGDSLATQSSEALARAIEVADQVNARAQEIAKLNQQIVAAQQSGQDASDLLDQRNLKLLNLSELVDVRTVATADGGILVQTGGVMLVEGDFARTLSVSLDEDGKLAILASRPGGGQPETNITAQLTGGQLAGIKEARDGDLFDVAMKFNQLVFDVATAINQQHLQGVGLDGVGLRNIFDVGSTSEDAARLIRVSADIAGDPEALAAASTADGLPGGSDNALLLGNLVGSAVMTGGRTPAQAYGDLTGTVGTRRASAQADAELRLTVYQQAQTARESTSGVSLDDEMVALERYQRAYQAACSLLTVVDDLLSELMSRVGR